MVLSPALSKKTVTAQSPSRNLPGKMSYDREDTGHICFQLCLDYRCLSGKVLACPRKSVVSAKLTALDTCKEHRKEDNGEHLATKDLLEPACLLFVIHRLGRMIWDFSVVFSQPAK